MVVKEKRDVKKNHVKEKQKEKRDGKRNHVKENLEKKEKGKEKQKEKDKFKKIKYFLHKKNPSPSSSLPGRATNSYLV